MWIIKLKYVDADKKYTKVEESAKDEYEAIRTYLRMTTNWYHILCKDVKVSSDVLCNYKQNDFILKTIQFQLQLLNDGSTFEISMEELEE